MRLLGYDSTMAGAFIPHAMRTFGPCRLLLGLISYLQSLCVLVWPRRPVLVPV